MLALTALSRPSEFSAQIWRHSDFLFTGCWPFSDRACTVNHSKRGTLMDAGRRPTEEKWSNSMSTLIAVALIASGAPAQADTTVCLGNMCIVTSRDGTNHERSLSDINEEARKESLENIRDI